MKRDNFFVLLLAEAAVLIALLFLPSVFPKADTILTFPFEQIAAGLTALAGMGKLGAGLAMALWLGLSLAPMIPAVSKTSGRTGAERGVLVLLSAAVLLGIYGMISPRSFLIPNIPMLTAARSVLGVTAWSVIALYAVVRLVGLFRAGDMPKLLGYIKTMLHIAAMLCVAVLVLDCLDDAVSTLKIAENSLDGLFAVLRFCVDALPYALDIAVIASAIELLCAVRDNDKELAPLTGKLTKLCCTALTVPMGCTAAFNLLQSLFMSGLLTVNISANIPVASIIFTLLVLLTARLVEENRRLREDNDLFI